MGAAPQRGISARLAGVPVLHRRDARARGDGNAGAVSAAEACGDIKSDGDAGAHGDAEA